MVKNIFELTQHEKDKLGIIDEQPRPNMRERFIELFHYGKRLGKKGLTINDLTGGYYNLFCKNNKYEKIYNVLRLSNRLRYYFTIMESKYSKTYENTVNESKQYPKSRYLFHDRDGLYILIE